MRCVLKNFYDLFRCLQGWLWQWFTTSFPAFVSEDGLLLLCQIMEIYPFIFNFLDSAAFLTDSIDVFRYFSHLWFFLPFVTAFINLDCMVSRFFQRSRLLQKFRSPKSFFSCFFRPSSIHFPPPLSFISYPRVQGDLSFRAKFAKDRPNALHSQLSLEL